MLTPPVYHVDKDETIVAAPTMFDDEYKQLEEGDHRLHNIGRAVPIDPEAKYRYLLNFEPIVVQKEGIGKIPVSVDISWTIGDKEPAWVLSQKSEVADLYSRSLPYVAPINTIGGS